MTLESKAAFARRIGVNKSTITRAAQAGRLVMREGLVDIEPSLARWHATAGGRPDVSERHAQQRGADIPQASTPTLGAENATAGRNGAYSGGVAGEQPAQPGAQPEVETSTDDSRTRYKTMVLRYENETIKLEMALRRGMRHPLPAVRREALGLGTALRAAVERMIDQTAPRLAAEPNRAARAALLHAECAAVQRGLRLEFLRALRRLRQQGGRP